MTSSEPLTERELRVLEAVIQSYVETAEPAASQLIARQFGLGISSATIRSVMNDLEQKGMLTHPHTSAGRVPTDRGYRVYVDGLMSPKPLSASERTALHLELTGTRNAVSEVLHRAAQVLGVLTQELGVAVGPKLDAAVLERLDVVPVATDRMLLVFNLRSGVVRTIFVQVPGPAIAREVVERVAQVLNERLGGLTLREIRATLPERLRDASASDGTRELLNIFIAEGEEIFGGTWTSQSDVVLGSAQLLVDQPEFASNTRMRGLIELTERRDLLRKALAERPDGGVTITIGGENLDPRLADFTLVTGTYVVDGLRGVIGVMGPTRMPYDKVIGLVEHTSRLVEGLLQ